MISGSPTPISLAHLLVPADLSGHEEPGIRYAAELAQTLQARVTLLHVLDPLPSLPEFSAALGDLADRRRQEALQKLSDLSSHFSLAPHPPVCVLREGRPFEQILEGAAAEHADLIVLSRHGGTGLFAPFLGSTTERVIRHALCPVLVPSKLGERSDGPVLVATDFSEASFAAFPWAERFSQGHGVPLVLAHVRHPLALPGTAEHERHATEFDLLRAETEAALERCRAEHLAGASVECLVLEGAPPFRVLCRAAEQRKASLLVVATHGTSGWPDILVGSTAERIARHATVPVLTVPPSSAQRAGRV